MANSDPVSIPPPQKALPSSSTAPSPLFDRLLDRLSTRISRNTLIRMISGLALLPLVIVAFYQGDWLFVLLACVVFGIATLEVVTIIQRERLRFSGWVALGASLGVALSFGANLPSVWVGIALVAGVVIISYEMTFGERLLRQSLRLWLLTFGVGLVAGMVIAIRQQPAGLFWGLLVMFGTSITDTLAFAGGRTYGKTPLMPAWSPKKTVEGAVTGIIGAIFVGLVTLWHYNLLYPLPIFVVIIAPFAATLGDLIESRFKRLYRVKDSMVPGLNVVPGHGGMLDRIDSLMLVTITVYTILWLAQVIV